MRPLALASALALALLVVGCFAPAATQEKAASLSDPPAPTTRESPTAPFAFAPAQPSPLHPTLTTDAPAWIDDGATMSVALARPADAVGDITVQWALVQLAPAVDVPWTLLTVDTGSANEAKYLHPGQAQTVKFPASGTWEVECRAQHGMSMNLTVVKRDARAPQRVDVDMWDDRFVPDQLVVSTSTLVVFHDRGAEPHTATARQTTYRATLLDLPPTGGSFTMAGDRWMRVVALVQDAAGHVGTASVGTFVAPVPRFAPQNVTIDFTTTHDAPITRAFTTTGNGTLHLSYAVSDPLHAASNGATPDLALVTVKLAGAGVAPTASESKSADKLALPVAPGAWSVTITPQQGAKITGTLSVAVDYDLTPPPAPSEPGR